MDLLNKLLVGTDGKTATERLKVKKFRCEVLLFASLVMLRVLAKVQVGVVSEPGACS